MKASKLFLIFIVAFAVSFCLCASKPTPVEKTPAVTPKPTVTTPAKPTPVATPKPTSTPTPEKNVSAEKIKLVDGECLNCHNNPSKKLVYPQALSIPGHINGSAYCKYCHVPNVTKMTPQQIDEYITELHHKTVYAQKGDCQYCHKAAMSEKSIKNCGTCHDNGNLLAIHSPYHVGCKECHGYNFMRIHVEKKPFPPKFPIPPKTEEVQKGWI